MADTLCLDDFDYDLPAHLIAQAPLPERSASRLLHVSGAALSHHRFSELAEFLEAGDLLVLNETKVIPARLPLLRQSGGRAEVLMLEPIDGERKRWEALVRPARKIWVN